MEDMSSNQEKEPQKREKERMNMYEREREINNIPIHSDFADWVVSLTLYFTVRGAKGFPSVR